MKDVTEWVVPYILGLFSKNLLKFLLNKYNDGYYLTNNYLEHTPYRTWIWHLYK